MVTVEQVHADFDTATDRILAAANAIITQANPDELRRKALRFEALGLKALSAYN
ncbi:hypothetical protein KRR40_12530 [Niabella defluvii]|nr:hypothetical protein KRR40_12530 [Niabella sp. I65]